MPDLVILKIAGTDASYMLGEMNHHEQDEHCKNKGDHEHQDYADYR